MSTTIFTNSAKERYSIYSSENDRTICGKSPGVRVQMYKVEGLVQPEVVPLKIIENYGNQVVVFWVETSTRQGQIIKGLS